MSQSDTSRLAWIDFKVNGKIVARFYYSNIGRVRLSPKCNEFGFGSTHHELMTSCVVLARFDVNEWFNGEQLSQCRVKDVVKV